MMVRLRRLRRCLSVAVACSLASCGAGARHATTTSPPGPRDTTTVDSHSTADGGGGTEVDRQVFDHTLLASGARYRATGEIQDIDIVFRGPSVPLYAEVSPDYLGMSTDQRGANTVVALLPVAMLRVFPTGEVDAKDLEEHAVAAVTTDAPADVIAWLASRPFLANRGIDEHMQVGSLNGRGFTYEVGDLSERARACGPAPAQRCAATAWAAASGITLHVAPGERGRVLEVSVAGQAVLVVVTEHPASAELVSSLRFEARPVPDQAGHAARLPYFAPALEAGRKYYIDKIGTDIGLVTTSPATAITASQREDLAWFGDPTQPSAARHYYFVALDAGATAANEDPSLDPYALVGPTGIVVWELTNFLEQMTPLPDDPILWLSHQLYVQVEQPVRDEQIGGQRARIVDVRAQRLDGGLRCPDGQGTCVMPFAHAADAFPVVISSEYVTRFVDLTVGNDHVLIAADLGTPGERLLASLCAFSLTKHESCP